VPQAAQLVNTLVVAVALLGDREQTGLKLLMALVAAAAAETQTQ